MTTTTPVSEAIARAGNKIEEEGENEQKQMDGPE